MGDRNIAKKSTVIDENDYVDDDDNDLLIPQNNHASTTMNFRIKSFDGSIESISGQFEKIQLTEAVDVSAEAVIYVHTEMMRKTFQFQTAATDIGDINTNLTFTDENTSRDTNYYVYDESDKTGAWKWDISASETTAYHVWNPAHAMLDVMNVGYPQHRSRGHIEYAKRTDPFNRRQNMIKQDFARHISKEVFKSAELLTLFNNEDDILANIELGGINAWNNEIKPVLNRSRNKHVDNNNNVMYGQTNEVLDQSNNLTRDIIFQMLNYVPKRFDLQDLDIDLSGSSETIHNHTLQYYIRDTHEIQPVPFMDGDTLIFTFKIKGFTQTDLNNETAVVPDRTYAIKICMVGEDAQSDYGNGDNDDTKKYPYFPHNVHPTETVYQNLDLVDYGNGLNYYKYNLVDESLHKKYFITGTETIRKKYDTTTNDNVIETVTIDDKTNSITVTLKKRITLQPDGILDSNLPGMFKIDGVEYNYSYIKHVGPRRLTFGGVINYSEINTIINLNTSKLEEFIIFRKNPLLTFTNVDSTPIQAGAGGGDDDGNGDGDGGGDADAGGPDAGAGGASADAGGVDVNTLISNLFNGYSALLDPNNGNLLPNANLEGVLTDNGISYTEGVTDEAGFIAAIKAHLTSTYSLSDSEVSGLLGLN